MPRREQHHQFVGRHRSRTGGETFDSMVKLPDDRAEIIATYLGAHFPERADRPKTVVVPGDLKVNIKEWVAPTLGSRPHDPCAAPDGTIYWAGMWGRRDRPRRSEDRRDQGIPAADEEDRSARPRRWTRRGTSGSRAISADSSAS